MCNLWSCYLFLLVIAYEYLDESRSHYSNYYGNDSNNNALLPFFLIHFICCTIASIADVAIAMIIEMNLLSFFIYFTPF